MLGFPNFHARTLFLHFRQESVSQGHASNEVQAHGPGPDYCDVVRESCEI